MRRTGIARGTSELQRRTPLRSGGMPRTPQDPAGGANGAVPVPRGGFGVRKPPGDAERRTRHIVVRRSGGISEYTGAELATDASHRVGAGVGGPWEPANIVHLERWVHAWLHANPAAAKETGLMLESWQNPGEWPVWLARHSGWVFLRADGAIDPAPWAPPPAMLPRDPR